MRTATGPHGLRPFNLSGINAHECHTGLATSLHIRTERINELVAASVKTRFRHSLKAAQAKMERQREMFYLTTHSTHFIYGYMASDI